MKERKTMKKVFALVLAFAMLLTMSTTVFAADDEVTRTNADVGTVTITGIESIPAGEGEESTWPTVTLYQVAWGNYGGETAGAEDAGEDYFSGYEWAANVDKLEADGTTVEDGETALTIIADAEAGQLTATDVTALVYAIENGTVPSHTPYSTSNKTIAQGSIDNDGKYTAILPVGAYVAVITGAGATIYNPVFLTVSYNADNQLIDGSINLTTATYGSTAVAKKSNPSIDKKVDDTVVDDSGDEAVATVSVGDVVTYTLTPTLPSYPANAVNKTVYISDTLSTGLDFMDGSIVIKVGTVTLTQKGNDFVDAADNVVATLVAKEGTTFNLNFDYDKLVAEDGSTAAVVITYNAVVNENAVVGSAGNDNTVKLYYANDPSEGSTYDPEDPDSPDPDEAENLTSTEDTETVYTYQIAFHKVGEGEDAEGLAGAVFEIRDAAENLVDTVVTNEAGYAVSSKVSAGAYTVKEIEAPNGYSLNTTPFTVTANWTTATKTVESNTTSNKYSTTDTNNTNEQVGWIVDGTFYEMDAYDAESEDVKKAYIVDATVTSITTISTEVNEEGAGTAVYKDNVQNTKMSSLPSTGGVGTFVFTIAGCLIMVAAVAIFMVSKKKASN